MAICKNCGHVLEGKRIDAKYCSDICRVIFNRNIKAEPVTDNVTDKRTGIDSMIKSKPILTAQGHVRVSKPGDADYEPQCETTKAFVEDRYKRKSLCFGIRTEVGKRGLDIKVFEDLPADVQLAIKSMSMDETGYVDEDEKAKRTAAAIRYQHLSPDRYYSPGIAI